MQLKQRSNNILKDNSATDLSPAWAASYQVVALPVGAVASSSSSGTTATVKAGHGFAAGDAALIYSSGVGTFVAEVLSSVTATTLVWSSATPTIADGDLICNLGPDTMSGGTADYNASPMKVFERADTSDAISASTVTCDSQGDYSYWTQGDGANWELVLDPNGDVVGVVPGWAGVPGRLNPCDYGCVGDNSTNNRDRMKVAVDAAANAGKTFFGPPGSFRLGDGTTSSTTGRLLIPSSFKAINDPNFILVKHFGAAGSSTQTGMLTSVLFATASAGDGQSAANDNIWWQGGRMTVSDAASAVGSRTMGGTMIGLYSNKCTVKDVVIEEWGDNTVKGFACHVYGNDVLIDNVRAYSTVTEVGGSDGIGWAAGSNGKIVNCHVESADDCFTMSSWTGPPMGEDTLNGVIANCTGVTPTARIVNVSTPTGDNSAYPDADIRNIHVTNVAGTGGSAAGFHVKHGNDTYSTGTIENIRFVNCTYEASGVANANPRSIEVYNELTRGVIRDISFHECTIKASAFSTLKAGIAARIIGANNVAITNCKFDLTDVVALQTSAVLTYNSDGFRFTGNRFKPPTLQNSAGLAYVQIGTGSTAGTNAVVIGNHIEGLIGSSGSGTSVGIDVNEGAGCMIANNVVKLSSSANLSMGTTHGIRQSNNAAADGVIGKNTIIGNDLGDFFDMEDLDHAAGSTTQTHPAISQNSYEEDTLIEGNLGFNPGGAALVTATASAVQGNSPLKAGFNIVTSSAATDGVTLPYAAHGREITIYVGSNGVEVFPANSDNAGAGSNNEVFLSASSTVRLKCINAGAWQVVSVSPGGTFS